MGEIVLGILAIAVGALFCFRGLPAMRVVIALWGALVGFALGGGVVAETTATDFLATGAGWLVAVLAAVVFAALAYLYYAAAVILAVGVAGFAIGTGAMTAATGENWAVIAVGVIVGLALAVIAIVANLPAVLLMITSVLGGAVSVTGGAMVLAGDLETTELTDDAITTGMHGHWWWYALYVALVVLGVIAQIRAYRPHGTLRRKWRRAS